MASSLVIVGTQWGDEGKGKVVDILAGFADVVVRFQGGSNAGHTLVVDGQDLVTHLVPSGVMHPGKRCAIGPAVVVDPELLLAEIAGLQKRGLLAEPGSLVISPRAHAVMPYHKELDAAREATRGPMRIGTTLRGIGPCLEDKAARSGIRVCDLLDSEALAERIGARLPEVNAVLAHHGREPLSESGLLLGLRDQAERLAPFVGDVCALVRSALDRGRGVLFEGAQGAMLDVDHGTYPFVTAASTVAGAALSGLGIGPGRDVGVLGIVKAYSTRVGEGPMPTELTDERGLHMQQTGGEFGATTGRPRRCGWIDLTALRYATAACGCTSICVTKLDVLRGLRPLRLAVGYTLDGQPHDGIPADAGVYGRVDPVYEELDGWDEDLSEVREKDALPQGARRYLDFVENYLDLPVDIISVGPMRSETIVIRNPLRRG
ncbi:MAG: adenylosuccinate synthase [Deltaproteobacteria bacterium]|nr:adenylosuccinate synthase [Deltaproteobacteria bacterium]